MLRHRNAVAVLGLLTGLATAAAQAQTPAPQPLAPAPTQTPAMQPPAPAPAQSAAEFYKGKTVHFIVGYGPGGGYDTYARLLGRIL